MSSNPRAKQYKEGPKRLLQFSDEQILGFLSMTNDPMCAAALREVLYLRRHIHEVSKQTKQA